MISFNEILLSNLHLPGVNPLICGEQSCPPGHTHGPATRDYTLLHFVFSGQGEFHSQRGTYVVEPGALFVIRPGEITTYSASVQTPWHYCWMGFDCPEGLSPLLAEDVLRVPKARSLFRAVADLAQNEEGKELYITGKLYELFAVLSKNRTGDERRQRQYVEIAINYIEANYETNLRVSQIAKALSIDRSYLCKLFKKQTGSTPQQAIIDYRMKKAADLLVRGGLAVGEVAVMVGYNDVFTFSAMFKKHCGLSPSQWAG